jgi:hypothetical protein
MAASFYLGACGRNRREFSPSELRRMPRMRTSRLRSSKKFGTQPSPTEIQKSMGIERLSQNAVCHCSFQVGF